MALFEAPNDEVLEVVVIISYPIKTYLLIFIFVSIAVVKDDPASL